MCWIFLCCLGWLLVTVLDSVGASVTEGGVASVAVVEPLDVGDDVAFRAQFCGTDGATNALVFSAEKNDSAIA